MILIVTSEDDRSSDEVIEWLDFKKANYIRISEKQPLTLLCCEIQEGKSYFKFCYNGSIICSREIHKVWYRRSWLRLDNFRFVSDISEDFQNSINRQLESEQKTIIDLFWESLHKKALNSETTCDINKLTTLRIAQELGLRIPLTFVTSSKEVLLGFLKKTELITKNCTPGMYVSADSYLLDGYTEVVDADMLEKLPDVFYPSLFQELVLKSFELRIFYLEGEFYASAIFSQLHDQTKIDFRNYVWEKPNPTPPYNLPENLKYSLRMLMQKLNLNSGSIDMIVDMCGDYYFLEINPIGQFKQVSFPCNYYLEEKIALSLTK